MTDPTSVPVVPIPVPIFLGAPIQTQLVNESGDVVYVDSFGETCLFVTQTRYIFTGLTYRIEHTVVREET